MSRLVWVRLLLASAIGGFIGFIWGDDFTPAAGLVLALLLGAYALAWTVQEES